MLTEEEAQNIREQLFEQIERNFPAEKIENAKTELDSMNNEELEIFLKKNNMIKSGNEKCIFCSIALGEISSFPVGENEKAMAVLELNPISEGHVLIIPKEHELNLDSAEVLSIEKTLSKKIKDIFKPKKIEVAPSELFGHKILNILPVYKNESMSSTRMKVSPEQLEKLQKKFSEEKKEKVKKAPKPKKEKREVKEKKEEKPKVEKPKEEKLWLPKRIP